MSEVKAASASEYSAEDQAFHAFWYGHMHEDLIQAPLIGMAYSQARYIWDAARSTPMAGAEPPKQVEVQHRDLIIGGDEYRITFLPGGEATVVLKQSPAPSPSVEPAPANDNRSK